MQISFNYLILRDEMLTREKVELIKFWLNFVQNYSTYTRIYCDVRLQVNLCKKTVLHFFLHVSGSQVHIVAAHTELNKTACELRG